MFNMFKKNNKEIQTNDIILCKDGVKFKIIDIKEISSDCGFKRIELQMLDDLKKIIPTYTISAHELNQFIEYRYVCRNQDGCLKYINDEEKPTSLNGILEYEHYFDFMLSYELDIIIETFKKKYDLSNKHIENMRNMNRYEFKNAYVNLVFDLKGN